MQRLDPCCDSQPAQEAELPSIHPSVNQGSSVQCPVPSAPRLARLVLSLMRRGASQQLVTKYTSTKLYFSNDKTMLPKDPNTELYFINVKTFTVDLAEQMPSDFITISNWRLHCVSQHNNNQHHSSVLSIHLLQNLKTVRFLL